jgi:hypothetical protein
VTPANPDEPDDRLGRQDPFVHALTIWKSLDVLRTNGPPGGRLEAVTRSMDAVLVRHRHKLLEQYREVSPTRYQDSMALRYELGLEHWPDGQLLASNDPDRRTT